MVVVPADVPTRVLQRESDASGSAGAGLQGTGRAAAGLRAGLLVVAGLLWVYAAWQVFVPYTSSWGKVGCSAPVFADRDALYGEFNTDGHDRAERCATDRNWPQPVTALVLAAPLSGVGAVLFATGAVSLRNAGPIGRPPPG